MAYWIFKIIWSCLISVTISVLSTVNYSSLYYIQYLERIRPHMLLMFLSCLCTKLNQVSWTAGSDHILCATEGASRCGDMEIIAFKNNELKLEGTMQAHSATCDKLAIDNRYSGVCSSFSVRTVYLTLLNSPTSRSWFNVIQILCFKLFVIIQPFIPFLSLPSYDAPY